jgi:hypothetical protein
MILVAISNVVSLALAAAAFGVSLGTLAWSIFSFWLSGARYEVEFRHGYRGRGGVVSKAGYDPNMAEVAAAEGFEDEVFGVQLRNIGRAAGTVTRWSARCGPGWGWSSPTDPLNPALPKRLESGETQTWWAEGKAIWATIAAAGLHRPTKVDFEVELGTGKIIRTKSVSI